jgi:hypothetical protein
MVIHDPYFVSVRPLPLKDEAPTLVDPHTIVTPEVSSEELEPVSRR